MSKKIFVILISVLALVACDSTEAPDSGETQAKTVGQAKSVKKKSDAASEESCMVFFKEVAQTCHESIYDGLNVSCSTAVMTAKVAFSQKQGELFTDPNGNVSASKMGNALCAVNLKSLRKERNEAETEPTKDWGPKCTSYMKRLESICITPVANGDFSGSCSSVLSSINSLKRNETPEEMCEMHSDLLPK